MAFLEEVVEHRSGYWPSEASVLVFGLDLATARDIGRNWLQNAIVWCAEDAVPKLEILH